MIKLSSSYPFSGFLRVAQEFHEEKAIVKMKSLTFEREFEFEYKDVGEISDVFYASNDQMDFAFWLLVLNALTLGLFHDFISANSILLRIEQILYVCGLVLYFTGFKKTWRIHISDRNDNVLTYIKQTSQNRDLIPLVVEIIKNKAGNVQEITTANPFPEEKPAFEHVDYDARYLIKTTDRFYENEILGFQKSIFQESVYSIKYDRLSGKIYRGKSSGDFWGLILTLVTLLISIIAGLFFGFRMLVSIGILYVIFGLIGLFLLSLPFNFIKREVIGLYDKNGKIAYWTYINKSNKKKVEEIVEFIQSRISPATNNQLLKEQV
jgi:hypothetical protein